MTAAICKCPPVSFLELPDPSGDDGLHCGGHLKLGDRLSGGIAPWLPYELATLNQGPNHLLHEQGNASCPLCNKRD